MLHAVRRDPLLVCLIEQNPLAAHHLLSVLKKDPSIRVVPFDVYSTMKGEALPSVFLVDNCGLPLPLSEYLRRLRHRYCDSKYIVIDREQTKENMIRLLWFGIDGYVAYGEVLESLLPAIHSVAQGKIWVPREVLRDYVRLTQEVRQGSSQAPDALTLREIQIMELVKRRLSNKEISEILGIQKSTVKFHLSNIFSKLQVTNRHQLLDKNGDGLGWTKAPRAPASSSD